MHTRYKKQYESYITSAIHNGNWDCVVSYQEWLQNMQWDKQIKPEEVMAGTEKVWTYQQWEELLGGEFGRSIGIEW